MTFNKQIVIPCSHHKIRKTGQADCPQDFASFVTWYGKENMCLKELD
jgi:hypothetical protein